MDWLLQAILCNAVLASVLALLVVLLSRLPAVRRRPAVRHALWLLVLVKLITPPLLPVPMLPLAGVDPSRASERAATNFTARPVAAQARAAVPATSARFSADVSALGPLAWGCLLAGGISLIGTAWIAVARWRRARQWDALLQLARPGGARLASIADRCRARMGLAAAPRLCLLPVPVSPFLWRYRGAATIALPRDLADRLDDERLEWILCHELAHLARLDFWTNRLAGCVTALWWWHPVAWWARRELRCAQDQCCDAAAIATARPSRRQYAELLYDTLTSNQVDFPLALAMAGRDGGSRSLLRRFEMIADTRASHRQRWWAWPLILLGVVALPCMPTHAKEESIKLKDCPDAVRKTIRREAGKGTIVEVEREEVDGKMVYEAELQLDEHEYELTVDPQGTLVSKILEDEDEDDDADEEDDEKKGDDDDGEEEEEETTVTMDDLPRAVQKTLKREAKGGEIEEIVKEVEDGKVVYEAEIEIGEHDYEVEISEKGLLLSKVLEREDEEEEEDDD